MPKTPLKSQSPIASTHSPLPHLSVVDAIRSDLVNYDVALRQAAQHLQELDMTLERLEREEEVDVNMWGREEARSIADERAVAARVRRTDDFLRGVEERLADAARTFPQLEDYARDTHEIEREVATLSRLETEMMQELTKASTLLSVLQARRRDARSSELHYLEKLRSEAEELTSRVYQRPSPVRGIHRFPVAGSPQGVANSSNGSGISAPHPPFAENAVPRSLRYLNQPAPQAAEETDRASNFFDFVPTAPGPVPPTVPPPHLSQSSPFIASTRQRHYDYPPRGTSGSETPLLLDPCVTRQLQSTFARPGQHEINWLRALLSVDRTLVIRVDSQGNTLLHLACAARPPSLAVIEEIVLAGSPLRSTNNEGLTPFHVACLNTADGVTNEVKRYLMNSVGYAVDERTRNGETAAHLLAADDNYLPAMKCLVDAGCNLSERANVEGRWCTPADIAFLSGPKAAQMRNLLLSSRR